MLHLAEWENQYTISILKGIVTWSEVNGNEDVKTDWSLIQLFSKGNMWLNKARQRTNLIYFVD